MTKVGGKTIQEIQDMPMSKRHEHMRKHVNKNWGKDAPTKGFLKFEVVAVLETTTEEEVAFVVDAIDKDDATTKAREHIFAEFTFDEYEIERLEEVDG